MTAGRAVIPAISVRARAARPFRAGARCRSGRARDRSRRRDRGDRLAHARPPRPNATRPAASSSGPPYVSPNDPAMKYVMPVLHPGAAKQYPACRIGRVVQGHRGESILGLLNQVGSPKMPKITHAAPTQLLLDPGSPASAADTKGQAATPLSPDSSGTRLQDDLRRLHPPSSRPGRHPLLPDPRSFCRRLGISPACAAAETAGLHRELPRIPGTCAHTPSGFWAT